MHVATWREPTAPLHLAHPLHDAPAPSPPARCRRSLGREAAWVDLEASPKVDRENPPDLQRLAEAGAVLAPDEKGPGAVAKGEAMPTLHAKKDLKAQVAAVASGQAAAPTVAKPAAAAAVARKPAAGAAGLRQPRADDVLRVTDELVAKVCGCRECCGLP